MKSQETPDVMLINYGWLDTYSSDGSGFYDLNTLSDYIDFENYIEEGLAFGTHMDLVFPEHGMTCLMQPES